MNFRKLQLDIVRICVTFLHMVAKPHSVVLEFFRYLIPFKLS